MSAHYQEHKLHRFKHSQYKPMDFSDAWSFVENHYKMILCTLDSNGLPHAAPIWYVVIGDRIYFRAQPYKKKIKNILKRSEVCGVVEDGNRYTELRGAMIQGIAKVVDSNKTLRKQVFKLLAEKYESLRDTQRFPKSWQETYGKEHRVIVEFTPSNVVTWDNRKWIESTE